LPTLAEFLDALICPRCGWENSFTIREIEIVLRVRTDTITVKVTAGVCTHCGEEILDKTASDILDAAVQKLRDGDTSQLQHVGEAYSYP
jgi:YgiT-type zinc finger domain-containing protein